ncbi:cupin domain-containing protein [Marinobacterium rhizophilum]|uniref:Cupin domain-containing protein n=1 Tax=Marinobacterium rhizophilum TaxID=420402 RepID=A0ABY5HIS5_9GAMM|nr:cupin domain-containing protein [Marinobacterium rhizophilum]UTW11194.1 cupin domain-containing protein [Marinobacterium rhizophilum]
MIAVNGDMARRVHINTDAEPWLPSPGGEVLRKRLHLVGSAEGGEVTSLVRYPAGAEFPLHPHPDGEEILVLAGVFTDQEGDWPAGSYMLNPVGFEHAPSSKDGCLLFVKLRQYAGSRHHFSVVTKELDWQPTEAGVQRKVLYQEQGHAESMRLERWSPETLPALRRYPGGVEILVIEGSFNDEQGHYQCHDWLRLPAGAQHRMASKTGCKLYIKEGGLAALRSVPAQD